ncbi:SOS response-associated peptidase [Candidatus Falkowbacteria bacterium]|nr:SOS response-associated peptidase [Candidatus Falkowbacteria bacterium]
MCYHVSVNKTKADLEKRFGAKFEKPNLFKPIYYANGFDMPKIPVITEDTPDKIQLFYWGLIPHWIKDEEAAKKISAQTLNARAESIFDKPSFRTPIRKQRCLVLIDGFYDWRTFKGKKYPYYIQLKDNDAFALAGIWDKWNYKEKNIILDTFSVITTDANEFIGKIHNIKKRMPVILDKKEERVWLEKEIDDDLIKNLMDPYPSDKMKAHTISKMITASGIKRNLPSIMEEYKYNLLPAI